MRMVLKCSHGDYTTGVIDDPYGIPSSLVAKCIRWHEEAHKGHRVAVVSEKEIAK
jgi:hypothetical protein